MKNYIKRIIKVIFGLFLCGLGSFICIQANIGLAPWDAFSVGISNLLDTSFGNASVLIGIIILVIDIILKEKIGIGTVLNTILIGKFVDLIEFFNIIPMSNSLIPGIFMMLVGIIIFAFGSYFYISPGLGCGPRDSLMLALGKRFNKLPIGVIRSTLEGGVLIVGWLLGAKIGLGTILFVFMIGFSLEIVFKIFDFNSTDLVHESVYDSYKLIKNNN